MQNLKKMKYEKRQEIFSSASQLVALVVLSTL